MMFPAAKLHNDIFADAIEQKATRDGYGVGLTLVGSADPDVVVLTADLAESTRVDEFAARWPERFFDLGVAEQNLIGVAAGLAVSGKIAFVSSFASFSPGRNWEQIRTTVCYNNVDVKIAGHHGGVSVGPDGATHQALEDIALMRVLPNMKVIVPCDALEARKATMAAAHLAGPAYLRFAREKSPVFTTEGTPFRPGKAEIFWQSSKPRVALIACGPMVYTALVAAQHLAKEKIGSLVINNHTIKPLDEEGVVAAAKKAGAVVTIEEHQVAGGLGGAVAEALARRAPTPIEYVGVHDHFGQSGTAVELMRQYGLSVSDIVLAAKKAIRRAG